jgi:hypothetical protein
MAAKKSNRSIYNEFFKKFAKKGYVGSLIKNNLGNFVFEFELDTKKDVDEAKDYLFKNLVKYRSSSVNTKKVMVFF